MRGSNFFMLKEGKMYLKRLSFEGKLAVQEEKKIKKENETKKHIYN